MRWRVGWDQRQRCARCGLVAGRRRALPALHSGRPAAAHLLPPTCCRPPSRRWAAWTVALPAGLRRRQGRAAASPCERVEGTAVEQACFEIALLAALAVLPPLVDCLPGPAPVVCQPWIELLAHSRDPLHWSGSRVGGAGERAAEPGASSAAVWQRRRPRPCAWQTSEQGFPTRNNCGGAAPWRVWAARQQQAIARRAATQAPPPPRTAQRGRQALGLGRGPGGPACATRHLPVSPRPARLTSQPTMATRASTRASRHATLLAMPPGVWLCIAEQLERTDRRVAAPPLARPPLRRRRAFNPPPSCRVQAAPVSHLPRAAGGVCGLVPR